MEKIIKEKLVEIEVRNNIRILYACESGSRAWGFPSANSDYDVRFIYIHSRDRYLSIDNPPSHLTLPRDEELDLLGWDLKRTLQLVRKSNTTPFEWLQSSIVYQQNERVAEMLWQLCRQYFNARGNIFHYLGIAKSALQSAEGQQIGIKKLFYVIRPLLCAKWCLEKKQIAPIEIEPMIKLLSDELSEKITTLISYKSVTAESFSVTIDPVIYEFIEKTKNDIFSKVQLLTERRFKTQPLDDFFIETLQYLDR
ncbi:MAG: hypothetical protein XXXJIFNMEKO3_03382 [Candidatus Erwinia impunctatus]|nr:hypothetical protein XXXJIFNMEKO_03382 [Culicoides impunctatus]